MKKNGVFVFSFCLIFFLSLFLVSASQLRVTEEHPFLVNGEWIPVKNLSVGDNLTGLDSQKIIIKSLEEVVQSITVYNLHVNGTQDYFAGGILVHNKPMAASPPFFTEEVGAGVSPRTSIFRLRSEYLAQGSPRLNGNAVESWLNNPNSALSAVHRKLLGHLNHIKTEKFVADLESVLFNFNKYIALENKKPYLVLIGPRTEKSATWMYNIVEPALARDPVGVVYMNGGFELNQNSYINRFLDSGGRTFVIFDDGIYSGMQMRDQFVGELLNVYSSKPRDFPITDLELVINVPYTTRVGEQSICAFAKNANIPVKIFKQEYIPTIREILTPEEGALYPTQKGETLTFFDHKIPDHVSFASDVASLFSGGQAYGAYTPYHNKASTYYLNEMKLYEQYVSNYRKVQHQPQTKVADDCSTLEKMVNDDGEIIGKTPISDPLDDAPTINIGELIDGLSLEKKVELGIVP